MARLEANVIYRIAKGDEKAFDAFMDYYSSTLYRYAYGVVGHRESAEEVVSDVFFEVWKNRKSLLEINSLDAWLRTVTYRKAISCLRQNEAGPEAVSLDEIGQYTASPIETPDNLLISQQQIEMLNRTINELPDKCRHVFFLAKIEKIPYKEISALLNISVATINYHVAYAMDFLRKHLASDSSGKLLILLSLLGIEVI